MSIQKYGMSDHLQAQFATTTRRWPCCRGTALHQEHDPVHSPYSVLSGMTNTVLIPYNSGFLGHRFRMLGSKDDCPPHMQNNRNRPKVVTIKNSQSVLTLQ